LGVHHLYQLLFMTFPIQKTPAQWQAVLQDKGAEPVALQVTRHAATERPFTPR
jgi:peptide-methionine (R)-S-oxide reductase